MKKKEFTTLLISLIQEALQELSRTPHVKKYRRSKLHPAELERKARERFSNSQKPSELSLLFKTETNPIASLGGSADYEMPEFMKKFLNGTLKGMATNSVAMKILQGLPVDKKEAMNLAKAMILLPHFPLKQPRKLMNLLVLLATENQKES